MNSENSPIKDSTIKDMPLDDNREALPVDCVTWNPIPLNRVISITDRGKVYLFDIETLHIMFRENQHDQHKNPHTGNPFPEDIIEKVRIYSTQIKSTIRVTYLEGFNSSDPNSTEKEIEIDSAQKWGDILLEICRSIAGNVRKCLTVDIVLDNTDKNIPETSPERNLKSAYQYDLLSPFISVCQEILSDNTGLHFQVIPIDNKDPVSRFRMGIIYPALYKFAVDGTIEWLTTERIIQAYKEEQFFDDPDEESSHFLEEIVEWLQNGIPFDSIQDELLSGEIYITAEYGQSIIEKVTDLRSKEIISKEVLSEDEFTKFSHIVYSRVVDKFNLGFDGISGQYYQNKYMEPDYSMISDRNQNPDEVITIPVILNPDGGITFPQNFQMNPHAEDMMGPILNLLMQAFNNNQYDSDDE